MKFTRPINLTLARPTKWRDSLWISSARTWKRSMVATSPPLETETSSPQVPGARQTGITDSTDSNTAQLDINNGGIAHKISSGPIRSVVPWSPREIETLVAMSNSKKPTRAFQELLPGRSPNNIIRAVRFVRELGPAVFTPKSRREWTPDEIATLLRLRREGVRHIEIASYFPNRSLRSVFAACGRFDADQHKKLERRHRPYTAAEDDLVIGLVTRGIPDKLIALLLGRSRLAASGRIHHLGLNNIRRRWTPEKDERLLQLFKEGVSQSEVATILGTTVSSVNCRWFDIRPPETVRKLASKANHALSLTSEQMRDLEDMRDRGFTWASIQAQKFPHTTELIVRNAYVRQGGKTPHRKNRRLMSSADADVVQRLRNQGKTWPEIAELGVFSGWGPSAISRAFRTYVAARRRQESIKAPSSGSGGAT